jgi:uncharacterized protein YbaP (TraB family)
MKKISLSFVLLLIVIFTNAQAPKEKTVLWRIEGNGIKQTSYLFGTIHLMCPDQIKVDTVIKKCFGSTKELFLEIDMDDPQMMSKMMQNMSMTDGSTLENLLSKTDYDSMGNIFKEKAGMPMSLMGKAKPMLLMSALFPSLLGCAPEGWEKVFQDMAKARNIPLKGLETIEYQMQVFDSVPYKVQATMLKDFMFNLDSSKKSFEEMLGLYLAKDINGLHDMVMKDENYRGYEALLLDNRNKNWIPIISGQILQKPTFFAFGAAHLGGDNGVISLLRKKGFTVTAMNY